MTKYLGDLADYDPVTKTCRPTIIEVSDDYGWDRLVYYLEDSREAVKAKFLFQANIKLENARQELSKCMVLVEQVEAL